MTDTTELERQMKEAVQTLQSQIDDLENMIRTIQEKLDESLSQLKSLKSEI